MVLATPVKGQSNTEITQLVTINRTGKGQDVECSATVGGLYLSIHASILTSQR